MKVIDGEQLIRKLCEVAPDCDEFGRGVATGISTAIQEIGSLPTLTLDDLRPKGRWVDGECSNCGFDALYHKGVPVPTYTEFCPYCGADMRGGGEDG